MTAALLLVTAFVYAWLVIGSWRCRKCRQRGSFLWAVFHLHR